MIVASKRKESGSLKIGIEGEDGLDVDDDDEQTDEKPKLPPAAPGAQGSFAVDKLDAGISFGQTNFEWASDLTTLLNRNG